MYSIPAVSTDTPVAVLFVSNMIFFAKACVYTVSVVDSNANVRYAVCAELLVWSQGFSELGSQPWPMSAPLAKPSGFRGWPRAVKAFSIQEAMGVA